MSESNAGGDEQAARPWHVLSEAEVFEALGADASGLPDEQAQQRRQRYGPNTIREQEEVSAWVILLDQFRSPLIYVLLGALGVTLSIQSWSDAIVIGAVLIINGTIGFLQEYRAESAVRSLMEMVSPKARVRRGGVERDIDSNEIVPGDIVLLAQGRVVPADLRLLDTTGLQIDESPLTGESVPVNKAAGAMEDAAPDIPPADQQNMAFMGTAVTSGSGEGVAVAIGSQTEIGEIAEEVQEAGDTQTPLQLRIQRLATGIAVVILGVCAVAFVSGWLLGRDVFEMLTLAVALAVAAMPAGLPIVVTVALAIGVRRMAERNAVIRNLPVVEALGSCSVIVSDKTGTLTQNRMMVQAIYAGGQCYAISGEPRENEGCVMLEDKPVSPSEDRALYETFLAGVLCNDARLPEPPSEENGEEPDPTGDPMETALLYVARKAGLAPNELQERYTLLDQVPFATKQRFMATIHGPPGEDEEDNPEPLVFVKGAPERVASMCATRRTPEGGEEEFDAEDVTRDSEELARQGLRVLAMATGRGEEAARSVQTDNPQGLVFAGLQGLMDPPRESAVEAVDKCHGAGVRVMMVTGDHGATAAAIGRRTHLDRFGGEAKEVEEVAEAITGQEITRMDDGELNERLQSANVFARVEPGQKLRIVDRLKEANEIVSVTGDGVNDAPALKSAHLGAAMGSGTDVAKEASDMVITDDNFASVYAAVEEGRTAFRNIRMVTFFLLSTGAADVLIIMSALFMGWPLPLVPAQILWCNVVTNGIADVALAFEPGEKALFRRPPRPKSEGVLDRRLIERLVVVGVWLAVGTVAVFYWKWNQGGESRADLNLARTAALTTLVLFQKVHVFNCRSETTSIFKTPLLANKVLFAGVLASLAIHIAAIYIPVTQTLLSLRPLDALTWAVAAGVALTAIIVNELHKRFRP